MNDNVAPRILRRPELQPLLLGPGETWNGLIDLLRAPAVRDRLLDDPRVWDALASGRRYRDVLLEQAVRERQGDRSLSRARS